MDSVSTSEMVRDHEEGPKEYSEECPRILIVDDEEKILTSLCEVLSLTYQSYSIETASSAEDALLLIESNPVDLVITDLRLPEMDGLELSRIVRELSPKTQVMLMTAYGSHSILHDSSGSGCVAYIEKPFEVDALIQHINAALQSSRGFQAELVGFDLADLLQLYATRKATAVLSFKAESGSGILVIRDGVLVHAESDTKIGVEALLNILESNSAKVRSVTCRIPQTETLSINWQVLRSALGAHSRNLRSKILKGEASGLVPQPKRKARDEDKQWSHNSESPAQNAIRTEPPHSISTSSSATVWDSPDRFTAKIVFAEDKSLNRSATPSEQSQWEEELELKPEPPPPPPVLIPTPREWESKKLRDFINEGIEHFREYRLEEAKLCWVSALRIDPDCDAAKANLEILEQVLKGKDALH